MNVSIADRLAQRRKDAGLSQEELAYQLGVSRQAVSKWERSESSPDTNNLIALARLYDVSLDDLLYVDSSIEEDVEFEQQDRAAKIDDADDPAGSCADQNADECDATNGEQGTSADTDDAASRDGIRFGDGKDYVHISWKDGINVVDGSDRVHVGWDGVHVSEKGDDPTDVSWTTDEGVIINGKHYDSWSDAAWHYDSHKNVFLRFPYPILMVLLYLWIGFGLGEWLTGLALFLTIPLYYTLINALLKKRASGIVTALYTLGITVWYFINGFNMGGWHPQWLIFLTIPLVAWLASALFGHRTQEKEDEEV